jgi:hypothetical protein
MAATYGVDVVRPFIVTARTMLPAAARIVVFTDRPSIDDQVLSSFYRSHGVTLVDMEELCEKASGCDPTARPDAKRIVLQHAYITQSDAAFAMLSDSKDVLFQTDRLPDYFTGAKPGVIVAYESPGNGAIQGWSKSWAGYMNLVWIETVCATVSHLAYSNSTRGSMDLTNVCKLRGRPYVGRSIPNSGVMFGTRVSLLRHLEVMNEILLQVPNTTGIDQGVITTRARIIQ